MRIVLSGGGTAGHITPLLAIHDHLKHNYPESEITIIGNKYGMDQNVFKRRNLNAHYIPAGKWRRYHSRGVFSHILDIKTLGLNLRDFFRFLRGYVQSKKLLKKIKPSVVFIKGGYVGLPVGLAANSLDIPIIIHDSDTVPGLTNRILARFATKIGTGFPVENYTYDKDKLKFSGNIVRPIFSEVTPEEGREKWAMRVNMPWLCITGGSQGAEAINKAVINTIAELTTHFNVIHICGVKHFKDIDLKTRGIDSKKYQVFPYLHEDMVYALAAADIVVTRAGATTISEVAALKKPAIVIPHPFLSGGHQLKNAQVLKRDEAAEIIDQNILTGNSLVLLQAAIKLLHNKPYANKLAKNISKYYHKNSVDELAQLIITHGK